MPAPPAVLQARDRVRRPRMVRRFAHAGRPGAYLRIIKEGELGAGDEVEILGRPDHGITIATVARAIISDDGALAIAATAPALPPDLAAWMRERAGVTGRRTSPGGITSSAGPPTVPMDKKQCRILANWRR